MSGEEQGEGTEQGRTEAHLSHFFGRGEAFARQLIAENERLRRELHEAGGAIAVVEAEVVEGLLRRVGELEAAVAAHSVAAPAPAPEAPAAPPLPASAAHADAEADALRAQVERLEAENYHLAAVFIGLQQLHGARTVGDVLQTIAELLLNFVGVGVFTIYGVDEPRRVIFPLIREGGHIEEMDERSLVDDPPIAAAAALGRPWQGGDPMASEYGVLCFLPLQSGPRLVGIVALEAHLTQKEALSDDDLAVLAMLSEHAAIALENAWIRAQAPESPLRRDAVEPLVGA